MGELRWFRSVNHKDIRTLYMFTRLFFGLVGSSLSRLIRYELMTPRSNFLSNHSYNLIVTGHRVIIVFFFIMPYLIGRFGNWLECKNKAGDNWCKEMSWLCKNNRSRWWIKDACQKTCAKLMPGRLNCKLPDTDKGATTEGPTSEGKTTEGTITEGNTT